MLHAFVNLNWDLRNSSIKDFILGFGEPIFKLTIFLLEADEVPEIPYGKRDSDLYQGTQGIARSSRRIPVDIPKGKLIESSVDRIDPARQLREAGYPLPHQHRINDAPWQIRDRFQRHAAAEGPIRNSNW